jgi:uncharacterized protein (DUF1778 family)
MRKSLRQRLHGPTIGNQRVRDVRMLATNKSPKNWRDGRDSDPFNRSIYSNMLRNSYSHGATLVPLKIGWIWAKFPAHFCHVILRIAEPGILPDGLHMAIVATKSKRSAPTARLEARVPRALKQTLEKAAAVTGHSTLTSYVLYTLQTSAQAAIDQHERARLSATESKTFVEALLSPPPPNESLKTAFTRYRSKVGA